MPDAGGTPDPIEVGLFAYEIAKMRSAAITAAMVHLGDGLGLYRSLARMNRPVTSIEVAAESGLVERWVREWLYNQAAAGLVQVDESERFSMSAAAVAVLADDQHELNLAGMFLALPGLMQRVEVLPDSFRTGIGYDYDAHGRTLALGLERTFEPWMRDHLVADVLPQPDGVGDCLGVGTTAADIGCGAGGVVLALASAFPQSTILGFEISEHALDRARARLDDSGVGNAEFRNARESPLPQDHSLGFVTTFDCLHDMTDPAGMVEMIFRSLSADGTWLLVDIKAYDTFAENVALNPMAAMMYGDSVLSCMSSALSEAGGAGLGTLGLSERKASEFAAAAGFTRFRRLEIDHPVNAFYEIRP